MLNYHPPQRKESAEPTNLAGIFTCKTVQPMQFLSPTKVKETFKYHSAFKNPPPDVKIRDLPQLKVKK